MTSRTTSDPWLDRWLSLVGERTAGLPILELGCGGGRDSEVLAAAGHRVVGVDLSSIAIAKARERVPAADFHCQDVRAAFPVERAGVILASLSLHYFPWEETAALVERIRQTLVSNGLLLCRLNSTNDHHHGAQSTRTTISSKASPSASSTVLPSIGCSPPAGGSSSKKKG